MQNPPTEDTTVEQPISEMQFGSDDQDGVMLIKSFADGSARTVVTGINPWASYALTLGQAIQLRDFLNRHIDELALKQTGSLAERSSDDPTQLASGEVIEPYAYVKPEGCGKQLRLPGLVCGEGAYCASCAIGKL